MTKRWSSVTKTLGDWSIKELFYDVTPDAIFRTRESILFMGFPGVVVKFSGQFR